MQVTTPEKALHKACNLTRIHGRNSKQKRDFVKRAKNDMTIGPSLFY